MIDEIRDGPMDRRRGNHVVVIQDERHLLGQGSKAIDLDGQDSFYGWKLLGSRSLQECQGRRITAWVDERDSSEHIRPEACEIIIVLLQREPGRSKRSLLKPAREEGRLAKASRGRDEREGSLDANIELVRQAGTSNQIRANRWHGEFRDQKQSFACETLCAP
jgi:hypothetical protein